MKRLQQFDRRVNAVIRGWPETIRPFMSGVTFLGSPMLVLAIGFISYLSAAKQGQPALERAFIYAAAAYALNTLLKLSLHRRRPYNLDITTLGVKSYSFPSGHAFGTVIFYGLFSYLDFKYLIRPWNILIAALLWGLILLIGVSRVYLQAHYPSDVIGGWILGGLSLAIVIAAAF